METYKAGTSIKITSTIRDSDDALLDPDSVVITIQEGDTTPVVSEVAMTQESTGVYYYNYQSATDTPAGRYKTKVKAVSGSYTSIKEETGAFYLKS